MGQGFESSLRHQLQKDVATFLVAEDSTHLIRTPDRQKAGSTNRRSRFERPQGAPEGARRAAPSNRLCGTNKSRTCAVGLGGSFTVSAVSVQDAQGVRGALAEPIDLRGPTHKRIATWLLLNVCGVPIVCTDARCRPFGRAAVFVNGTTELWVLGRPRYRVMRSRLCVRRSGKKIRSLSTAQSLIGAAGQGPQGATKFPLTKTRSFVVRITIPFVPHKVQSCCWTAMGGRAICANEVSSCRS